MCTGLWWGNLRERDHWEEPGADGRIISRWIFRKWDVELWTMALGSTQPLSEMSTRSISWEGKGGRCVRLTTLPPSCAVFTKSGSLNFLEPSGPLQVCNGTDLPFGDRGNTVVTVPCYKSEGRWFDSSWCHWNFSLT